MPKRAAAIPLLLALALLAGGATECDPPSEVCVDADGDTFSPDGGSCGPVDCDDHNAAVRPDAPELCNGVDDDCNGAADESFTALGQLCTVGVGQCARAGAMVCDAGGLSCSATPGAPQAEACANGVDDDCDGAADAADPDCAPGCSDGDGDGYSPDGAGCGPVDCNDAGAAVHPGAAESCNGVDDDCDGYADNLAPGAGASPVSLSSACAMGDATSTGAALSADGRFVAFASSASNLVSGDTNGKMDVFVRDLATGALARASTSASGAQANGDSSLPSISADGRYVAFESTASNLVSGDTNGQADIFVKDRQTGAVQRASVSSSGAQGNGASNLAAISADGRFVAFYSTASNLVSGDTNAMGDVFVRDRTAGTTERVNVSSSGAQTPPYQYVSTQPAISADGRYVAFKSDAGNLVPGDTNGASDVFVRDRVAGTTERVSLSSSGAQGDGASERPAISADGRYVAFKSDAANLVPGDGNGRGDVFVRDRQTGATERVSVSSSGAETAYADLSAVGSSISADGRYVAFLSRSAALGPTGGKTQVFIRDRAAGATALASANAQGGAASDHCANDAALLSADGARAVFETRAANLYAADGNGLADVYVAGNPLLP